LRGFFVIFENHFITILKAMKLNNAQMLLLELFQMRPSMTDAELFALRDVIVKHLSKELDIVIERAMKERGVTAEDIERNSAAINENRTEYLKNIRMRSK